MTNAPPSAPVSDGWHRPPNLPWWKRLFARLRCWARRTFLAPAPWERDVGAVMREAGELAARMGHCTTRDLHLARVLMDRPEIMEIADRCNVDPALVNQALDAELQRLPSKAFSAREWTVGADVERCVSAFMVEAERVGHAHVTIRDLFVHVLINGQAASQTLQRLGLTAERVMMWVGAEPVEDDPPDAEELLQGTVNVVLYNDEVTTMEFVVDAIMKATGWPEQQALRIMFLVHDRGKGALGPFAAQDGRKVAEIIRSRARAHGMPLKVTVESVKLETVTA